MVLTSVAALGLAAVISVASVNAHIYRRGQELVRSLDQVRPVKVGLVLGAYVYPDGTPCSALEDRLLTGLALYRAGKVEKLLLSGDHGRDDYDEVNAMRAYLERCGVPKHHLFLDHAGFDTYNSLVRARDVFGVRDLVLITQRFHLLRALYIASALGLKAVGVEADRRRLADMATLQLREVGARVKAFAEVTVRRAPVYGGPTVDLDGDALVTHDQP